MSQTAYERNKAWRKKHPKKFKAQLKRYRKHHRKALNAYKKEWRARKKAERLNMTHTPVEPSPETQ